MNEKKSEHHESIREAFERYSEEAVAYYGGEHDDDHDERLEAFEGSVLDLAVWRRDGDTELARVEFLLAVGGPTVSVHVDEYDRVKFHHSWGWNESKGCEQTFLEVWQESPEAEVWVQAAESYREVWDR